MRAEFLQQRFGGIHGCFVSYPLACMTYVCGSSTLEDIPLVGVIRVVGIGHVAPGIFLPALRFR
jgi:hypothetical protein